jgi:hypothetical protein
MMKSITIAAAIIAALGALSVDGASLSQGTLALSEAHAVRGRPATPVSYAGAARRTTRRAVGATAATAAAVTTTCVQTVDVYGRVITRCR